MRDMQTELSLRREKGEKHLKITDGKILTTNCPFLWRTAIAIALGGPNPPNWNYQWNLILTNLTDHGFDLGLFADGEGLS